MLFRKIATILLLTFLFFNWVGYWLFISWAESRETVRWEARLDHEQYNAGELILFKVPATAIPYSNSSPSFQRADGELQVGDIHYRYVRKRLYNDSIEFLCIPDGEAGRLQKARNDIFRLAVDQSNDHGRSSPSGKASPTVLKVFWQQMPAFAICNFPAHTAKDDLPYDTRLHRGYARTGKQPPRQLFS
ncbi:MAG TPA: hypothetical protein VG605_11305 [Puia sp.]|jgi:hypothetical protein|nr:hypothetical protein [Puia sp.]